MVAHSKSSLSQNRFFLSLFMLFSAIALLLLPGRARAHGVSVFAWVDGDTVHVEGKFSGGRKVENSPVEVYGPGKELLLKGTTDRNGEFSFKVPRKVEMKVVLLAGMGHRGEWTIHLSDLEDTGSGGTAKSGASGTSPVAAPSPEPMDEHNAGFGASSATTGYMTRAEMQEAIGAALDTRLEPVMKLIVETRRSGPSVTDILGGIGYIFGLVGVAAYVSSRRRERTKSK